MYGDDDNYVKLDFVADNAAGQPVTRRIEFRSEIGGAVQNPQPRRATSPPRSGTCGWSRRATPTPPRTRRTASPGRRSNAHQRRGRRPAPRWGCTASAPARPASKPVSFDYFRLSAGRSTDDVAPVTTSTSPGPPPAGWYTGPVTVTLTARPTTPAAPASTSTEYQLDAASTWTAYTAPVAVSGDGTHTRAVPLDRQGGQRRGGQDRRGEDRRDRAGHHGGVRTGERRRLARRRHPGDARRDRRRLRRGEGGVVARRRRRGRPYTTPVNVTGDGAARAALQGHRRGRQRGDAQVGDPEDRRHRADGHRRRPRRRPALRRQPGRPGHLAGHRPGLRHQVGRPARWTAARTRAAPCRRCTSSTSACTSWSSSATDKAGNATTSTVRFFVTTSFRDMQNLLDRFKATSRLPNKAYTPAVRPTRQGPQGGGGRQRQAGDAAAGRLPGARRRAKLVPEAEVRDDLIRDADAMIVRLGGQPGAAARAAKAIRN